MNAESNITSTKQCIAVKAIIKNDEGKILVLKQASKTTVQGAGLYHPPGGVVELGETLLEALAREMSEETNLVVKVGRLLGVEEWQATIRGELCYFVGVFYECRIVGGEFIVDQEENTEAVWVGLEDLKRITVLQPSKKIIEQVLASS